MKISVAYLLITCFLTLLSISAIGQNSYYRTDSGYVYFISEAPLETIEAETQELKGIIEPTTNKFAFSLRIESFNGFNSPLQQQHFYENYMETGQHKKSTFQGKIIEEVDYEKDTTYEVRAKGKLEIHGKVQSRIIPSILIVQGDQVVIKADFTVLLADHNIHIPRIVKQKISEEIEVTVRATLNKE